MTSAEVAVSQNHVHSSNTEAQTEAGRANVLMSISALQEIGRRCHSEVRIFSGSFIQHYYYSPCGGDYDSVFFQVEFRSVLSTSKDLQFSMEVRVLIFLLLTKDAPLHNSLRTA